MKVHKKDFFRLPGNARGDGVFLVILVGFCILLVFLPTGFENTLYRHTLRVKAEVTAVDNTLVQQLGIIKQGDQGLSVKVLSRGRFRGVFLEANNMLIGKLELDSFYEPGDRALVVLDLHPETGSIVQANAVGHYRLQVQALLLAAFSLLLLLFARWTGLKALLSFLFSALVIWKLLIPGVLKGFNPLLYSGILVILMTGVIIFLIGGFSKKGVTAFLGAAGGVLITAALSQVIGKVFHIHGAVRPFSESLLYSGYGHLDLTALFLASVFIAASGAVMDLAMDIAAALHELREKNPIIARWELVKSGFNVGRAVVGTMTTTLLFAYSGGYTTLLMVFMAQGIPMENMLNLSYVSAEILTTLVGSFGLVLVAPLTALIGGFLYAPNQKAHILEESEQIIEIRQ